LRRSCLIFGHFPHPICRKAQIYKVCYEKYEKALEKAKNKLPECSRAIVRYEDEKKNNCRINWDLQNDEGIKAKELYESDKELDDSFNRLIQCAKI